nr:MAG TPA: hypothetical protein [Caudoviricetes sp.]
MLFTFFSPSKVFFQGGFYYTDNAKSSLKCATLTGQI